MYSLKAFGFMIADKVRMRAYEQALTRAVKPGSVVIDIGTGTGVLAFIACKLGARIVYAIEPNDLIDVAKEMADANGFSSRIKFIKDISTKVNLEEKADVVVSDLRGAMPPYGEHIPSVIDARTRFLKPGGILIPQRDTLWLSVVESPKIFRTLVEPWEKYEPQFDMQIARTMAVNHVVVEWAKVNELLTHPSKWLTLKYSTIESPNIAGLLDQKVLRSGTAHGFMVWFDAELMEGITFDNTPGAKPRPKVYRNTFFPFLHPVKVSRGNRIEIQITATLVDDDYIWNWNTRISDNRGRKVAQFEQSTFYSQRLSIARLKKYNLAYVPTMGVEGMIDKFIIDSMNGSDTIEKIAQETVDRFPENFKDVHDATARVSKLSEKYAE
jgi:type I protein arginine methyltransferase